MVKGTILSKRISKRELIARRVLEGWSTEAIVEDLKKRGIKASAGDVYQVRANLRFYLKVLQDYFQEGNR